MWWYHYILTVKPIVANTRESNLLIVSRRPRARASSIMRWKKGIFKTDLEFQPDAEAIAKGWTSEGEHSLGAWYSCKLIKKLSFNCRSWGLSISGHKDSVFIHPEYCLYEWMKLSVKGKRVPGKSPNENILCNSSTIWDQNDRILH